MEMRHALLNILEDLTNADLKKFQWYLVQDILKDFQPIPRSRLDKADAMKTVDKMIECYDTQAAVITLYILKNIYRNDLADKLTSKLHEKKKDVEVPSEPNWEDVVNKIVEMLNTVENPEDKSLIIDQVKKKVILEEISQYAMTNLPRGVCLIINNELFRKLKDRQGSYVDAVSLARVFSWLGFWVVTVEDQRAEQMRDTLKLFAGLNPNSLSELKKQSVKEWAGERKMFVDVDGLQTHSDAFVCCVLSHGCSEGIYGSDDEVLPFEELLSFFNGSNCIALKDKPKLFFVEACRIEPDEQRKTTAAAASTSGQSAPSDGTGGSVASRRKRRYDITDDSDMLIARSSTDKQKSFRKEGTGTWFIQSLCKQLAHGCFRQEDILMVLTDVGSEVSDKEDTFENGPFRTTAKQMPEVTSRLRSRLILPSTVPRI